MNEARNRGAIHPVYLGLGSNIDPERNLPLGVALLRQSLHVEAVSTAWETPAVGALPKGLPLPDFLNAALLATTPLTADQLKNQVVRAIEAQLGRFRTANKNAARTMDIDILIYDGEELEPEIWEQAFLAVPLAELLPGYTNRATGETLLQASQRLSRLTSITPRPEILSEFR